MKQELEFENWFDIFVDECHKLGHTGRIDEDSARMDYERGESPEEAARTFIEEYNS